MALGSQPRWTVRTAEQVGVDVGLREYMLRIYNYMASGLALTGIVAYAAAYSGFYASIARTPVIWLVILAPLGLVMWMSYGIQRMQASTAQTIFWVYSGLMGLSMSTIFLVFTGLTAWDTQQIKEMYYEGDGAEIASKKAVMGALRLYLDFINLFMMLLQLMGQQRD